MISPRFSISVILLETKIRILPVWAAPGIQIIRITERDTASTFLCLCHSLLSGKNVFLQRNANNGQVYGNHKSRHYRAVQPFFRIPHAAPAGQRRAFRRFGEPAGCPQDDLRVLRPLSEKDRGMHHQLWKDEVRLRRRDGSLLCTGADHSRSPHRGRPCAGSRRAAVPSGFPAPYTVGPEDKAIHLLFVCLQ